MGGVGLLVIAVTSIWVLVDAESIGVRKGRIQGLGDMGKWGWFFSCLGIWIFAFPFYLSKRNEFKEAALRSAARGDREWEPRSKLSDQGRNVKINSANLQYCTKCGHLVAKVAPRCPGCGAPHTSSSTGTNVATQNAVVTQNAQVPILGFIAVCLGVASLIMPYFAAVFFAPAALICRRDRSLASRTEVGLFRGHRNCLARLHWDIRRLTADYRRAVGWKFASVSVRSGRYRD